MAELKIAGSQILGFRTIFPICNMEVPIPCAKSPPHLFSRKLSTAKPIMLAQHPATAAPPASPVSPKAAQIAALLIGSVSAIPTITETKIPIKNGCNSVAHIMAFPTALAAAPIAGAHQMDKPAPMKMVTNGVTIISILVSLDTALPNSAAKMVTINTASGPPAPPRVFAATPTAASEKSTSGGHCKAKPMEIAIAGPVAALAYPPMSTRSWMPACSPIVLIIVPIKREAKRPCAIAPKASMPYLFAEIIIFLRFKNAFIFSIFLPP